MKMKSDNDIVYSMNVGDIQTVANQVMARPLTRNEILLVKESIGEHVDWFGAIESAIQQHIRE